MNAADAAYQILTKACQPLHYNQITYLALKGPLWDEVRAGKTPWMSMNRTLNEDPRFCQVGPKGVYAIVSEGTDMLRSVLGHYKYVRVRGVLAGDTAYRHPSIARKLGIPRDPKPARGLVPPVTLTPELACVIAAWPQLSESQKSRILDIVGTSLSAEKGRNNRS